MPLTLHGVAAVIRIDLLPRDSTLATEPWGVNARLTLDIAFAAMSCG
jgi:hypothetical protein